MKVNLKRNVNIIDYPRAKYSGDTSKKKTKQISYLFFCQLYILVNCDAQYVQQGDTLWTVTRARMRNDGTLLYYIALICIRNSGSITHVWYGKSN